MATVDLHQTFYEDRSSSSRDTLADRETQTKTDRNTPFPTGTE